jgi:hypothetical protein
MSSQRKSQRGKKLEDVVDDLRKEVWELRNISEKKEEEVRKLMNMVVNMEIEAKKDKDNYKRCMDGWKLEYNIRQQVVENLDRSEMEKQKMEMKLEILVRRWNEYEARTQEKDKMIFSEIRKNFDLETRIEDLELRMVCWESEKDGKDKQIEGKMQKEREIKESQIIEIEPKKGDKGDVEEGDEQESGRGNVVTDSIAENTNKNRKGVKDKINDQGKQKRRILLVGDVKIKTAREFCKEEGFKAWTLPGIDIVSLERKIRSSKKAKNESPEELLLYVGHEDIKRNDKSENIVKNLARLIKTTKEKYGEEVKIKLCKWSDYLGRYLNAQIDKLSVEEKVKMIRINPRWEMEDIPGEIKERREKAIGIALRKTMTVGQRPKENGWGFRPAVFWKKKV